MKQFNLLSVLFVAMLAAPNNVTGQAGETADDSSGIATTEIELDRLVHFLDPNGEAITVPAGRYTVERGDVSALMLVAVDGETSMILAEPSEHGEELRTVVALSVSTRDDEHHILLLQLDGKSLDASGSYSGVVPRAARRITPTMLSRVQVKSAYQNRLQVQIQQQKGAQLSANISTPFYIWNLSQFDVNQVWLVQYVAVPGQDVGDRITTLLTDDLSEAVPCADRPQSFHYNDRIRVNLLLRRDSDGKRKVTPYYLLDFVQARLCVGGTITYWGDSSSGGGGYVTAENATPRTSRAFAPGVVDVKRSSGSNVVRLSGYTLARETMFIFDDGYTRHEQALCGPDGGVYLYRKPYPTYFHNHEEYESGPIPLAILGSYVGGYYESIVCDSR